MKKTTKNLLIMSSLLITANVLLAEDVHANSSINTYFNGNGIYNVNVNSPTGIKTITISSSDGRLFTINSTNVQTTTVSHRFTVAGNKTIMVEDMNGVVTTKTIYVSPQEIDSVPPTINYSINQTGRLVSREETSNYIIERYVPIINISASDNLSGIALITVDGQTIFSGKQNSVSANYYPYNFSGTAYVVVKDYMGNVSTRDISYSGYTVYYQKPDYKPSITATYDTTSHTLKTIPVTVNASDDRGITALTYSYGELTASEMRTKTSILSTKKFNADKNGVYTIYTKDTGGNEVIKHITIKNVNENKLLTTPALSNYFTNIEWIERDGILSLSLTPKLDGPLITNYDTTMDSAFALVEKAYLKDYRWNNQSQSIYDQYVCHVYFAGENKTPWNLEPQRQVVSGLSIILSSCNPPIDTTIPAINAETYVYDGTKLLFNVINN